MALIAMAVHDTEENGRTKYTKECLDSLFDTVDFNKHRLFVIDNNSCLETFQYIPTKGVKGNECHFVLQLENIGTAAAINKAIQFRKPNEVVIKMDNDVVIHQSGWVDDLEQVFADNPEIGICGLKRDDVYGNFIADGKLLYGDDIMGTCTALNPALLDKIGYYNQFSVYGYDDSLLSARSLAAGFKNAYLPHIKITHLDEGGTEYTEWKKREASQYLSEATIAIDMYRSGKISPYYDGGFND